MSVGFDNGQDKMFGSIIVGRGSILDRFNSDVKGSEMNRHLLHGDRLD